MMARSGTTTDSTSRRGRINCPVAYCSMAWPIQPMVRPIAKSVSGAPAGSLSTRATAARAKSRLGRSASAEDAASATSRTNASSAGPRVPLAQLAEQHHRARIAGGIQGMPEPVDRLSPPQPGGDGILQVAARGASRRASTPTRAPAPPCLVPSSAASPAITTAYGLEPADATQRAVNEDTLSSWSAQRISAARSTSTPRSFSPHARARARSIVTPPAAACPDPRRGSPRPSRAGECASRRPRFGRTGHRGRLHPSRTRARAAIARAARKADRHGR